MLSAVDPLGRTAHLTADRWEHIIDGHPEMGSLHAEVLKAIREPSEVAPQPACGRGLVLPPERRPFAMAQGGSSL